MDTVNDIFGAIFEGLLALFGGLSPAWSLTIISVLLGAVMLLAFKHIGDPDALEGAKNRMQAHLMEMRLFDREPKIVLVAFGRLMASNAKFFVATLRPAIVATAPMILLFLQMEHYYGLRPLRPGESTVVTVSLSDMDAAADMELHGDGVAVETLPVRSMARNEVSWRIRATEVGEGALRLALPGTSLTKSVSTNTEPTLVSARRVRAAADLLRYPIEEALPRGPVRWVEVDYPRRSITISGMTAHWLVWLVVISLVGAWVVRYPLAVWRSRAS